MTKTVYISIHNSDDRLTQSEWAEFQQATHNAIQSKQIHGRWTSLPNDPWQNACWRVELEPDQDVVTLAGDVMRHEEWLRARLAKLADAYRQDSIEWSEAIAEFIAPTGDGPR